DERKRDKQARLGELGNNPGQVGPRSAGQSGDPQSLSGVEESADESVEELADTDQSLESARVEGVEMPTIILNALLTPTMSVVGRMTGAGVPILVNPCCRSERLSRSFLIAGSCKLRRR